MRDNEPRTEGLVRLLWSWGDALQRRPLVPTVTPIRALHFQELRERTNAVRLKCGGDPFAFTDPVLETGVTVARAVHIVELRTALNGAYAACGMALPVYAHGIESGGGTVIRAEDVADLRGAIITLELSAVVSP